MKHTKRWMIWLLCLSVLSGCVSVPSYDKSVSATVLIREYDGNSLFGFAEMDAFLREFYADSDVEYVVSDAAENGQGMNTVCYLRRKTDQAQATCLIYETEDFAKATFDDWMQTQFSFTSTMSMFGLRVGNLLLFQDARLWKPLLDHFGIPCEDRQYTVASTTDAVYEKTEPISLKTVIGKLESAGFEAVSDPKSTINSFVARDGTETITISTDIAAVKLARKHIKNLGETLFYEKTPEGSWLSFGGITVYDLGDFLIFSRGNTFSKLMQEQ